MKTLKDKYHLLIKQSKIGMSCINRGYALVKASDGKIYKIRELG